MYKFFIFIVLLYSESGTTKKKVACHKTSNVLYRNIVIMYLVLTHRYAVVALSFQQANWLREKQTTITNRTWSVFGVVTENLSSNDVNVNENITNNRQNIEGLKCLTHHCTELRELKS